MNSYLQSQIASAPTPLVARSMVREYLQARILQSLQQANAMLPLAFHGGTALRFLYHLPRYSEDLDFARERRDAPYNFRHYLMAIQADLRDEDYLIEIRVNDQKIVNSALIRFRGLWHDLGLSPHPTELLAIK
jgi:hypothetical protein